MGSFELGANTLAARSLCVRVLLLQIISMIVMLASYETVYTSHLSVME